MSRYDKYVNKGEIIDIDGEEWVLKAAGSNKVIKPYFALMRAFKDVQGTDESSTAKMMENFTDETAEAIQILIEETLRASYPDEDDDKMQVFAMKHLMTLMPVVMQLYAPDTKETEKAKKIKAMMDSRKAKG